MATLISMLDKVLISIDNEDRHLSSPNPEDQFCVQSFYDVLVGSQPIVFYWKFHWNKLIPPRVTVFCWVARL